jgi:hypothetical protein
MAHRAFLPVLALVTAPALAQDSDVERVLALGKSDNRVMEHLDHLANRIGPRLTGSENYQIACEWAKEQFEAFGLLNVRLEPWGEFPVGFNRGPARGRAIAPVEKELELGTNAWTAGTKGRVRGPAILAPTNDEELEAAKTRFPGAWVLMPQRPRRAPRRPAPEAGSPEGAAAAEGAPAPAEAGASRTDAPPRPPEAPPEPDGPAPPDRAFLDRLDKVLAESGIAGTIRPTRNELILTGGRSRIAWDTLPARPEINLLVSQYNEIRDLLKQGQEVVLEFDVRNWFKKGPIPLSNVIAEIPGTEKPDEVVIVGGHLDSWDGATGTTDNGTGVATTMEAARLLAAAGVHPKRTIRFMLWGGEEQGLLGSRAYVEKHKDDMAKVSAVLVHDMGTNYLAGITVTPPMKEAMEAVFAPIRGLDPEMPFEVREVTGLRGGGSDHASFLSADVPAFFWTQSGRANYTHTHHTQYDTYDAAIPEYQKHSAIVAAVGALGIANLPDLLSRENLRAPGGGGFGGGRRLGIELSDNLTVEEVTQDGAAARAGFRVGDRIVKVGDTAVSERFELFGALFEAGTSPKVKVLRDGQEVEIAVELPPRGDG